MSILNCPLWANWPFYVVGDIHLGDRSSIDVSVPYSTDLIVFIERMTAAGHPVIINGDWLECLYFNFMKVLQFNPLHIMAVMQNPLVFLIPGNHSIPVGYFQPFFPSTIFDRMILGRYQIFHGHELDDLVNKPYLRKPTKILAKLVTHYSKESNTSWLINWSRSMARAEHENSKLIEAIQGLETFLTDCYLLSHTHQEYDFDGWYYNTGSWSTPREPYLEVWPERVLIKYNLEHPKVEDDISGFTVEGNWEGRIKR